MPSNLIPAEFMPFAKMLFGGLLFCVGLSYGYKFFLASFLGRLHYWAGLEQFGWYFAPMTILVTPLLVFTAPSDKNLIRQRTAGWIHLIWGPTFFLLSLMMLVAGADFMGLEGTRFMNFVLTCGRPDVPPAITYQPPFTYKFPFLKKARKTVFRLLTADIYMDKSKSLNTFEQEGRDLSKYDGSRLEDEDEEAERAQQQQR